MAKGMATSAESSVQAEFEQTKADLAERRAQFAAQTLRLPVRAMDAGANAISSSSAFIAKHFLALLVGAGVVLFNGQLVMPASGAALTALLGGDLGQRLYRSLWLGGFVKSHFPKMTKGELCAYGLMMIAMVVWHFVARILFLREGIHVDERKMLGANTRLCMIVAGSFFLLADASLVFVGIMQQASWTLEDWGIISAVFFTLLYLSSMVLFGLFSAWVTTTRKE